MANCFSFLLPYSPLGNAYERISPPDRVLVVGGRYAVAEYCDRPELQEDNFFYSSLPRCFALMQEDIGEAMGVSRIRELPNLDLYGQGVLIGIVDTGIRYTEDAFWSRDGQVRIASVWDQTVEQGESSEIPFGARYGRDELQNRSAPTTDTMGHGTALARLAAGSPVNGAEGIAPNAELIIVRLRQAPEELKEYYRIQTTNPCYSETDIMLGLQYLEQEATRLGRPIVMLLALGSNSGGHRGNGYLEQYIGDLCRLAGRQVVIAAGNEGNAGHHFSGVIERNAAISGVRSGRDYTTVQLRVTGGESMTVELWCQAPALLAVGVESPGGQVIDRIAPISGRYEVRDFVLEGSNMVVTYQTIGLHTSDPLVMLRFTDMSEGIWTIRVYPERIIGPRDAFDLWLPVRSFLRGNAEFLKPNPDVTVTAPGNAPEGMTITAYDAFANSIYPPGGRGFTKTGAVKPDLAAPYEPGGSSIVGDGPVMAGTSMAAAAAVGANALLFEWAITREERPFLTGTEATAYFINGAERDGRIYPNREWGYGKLNLYGAIAENR